VPWLTGTPSNGGSARLWRGAIRDGDTSSAKPRAYDVAGAWRSVSHVAGGKRVGACASILQNACLMRMTGVCPFLKEEGGAQPSAA
jgi:hypothetical protein